MIKENEGLYELEIKQGYSFFFHKTFQKLDYNISQNFLSSKKTIDVLNRGVVTLWSYYGMNLHVKKTMAAREQTNTLKKNIIE